MVKRIWQVWSEDESGNETVLFEGSKQEARNYYAKHGGEKAGLHLGYLI